MIYLVRHGEAAAKWGDALDPGLSARGQEQAETVTDKLQRLGANSAITSPMLRCRETAAPFEQALGIKAVIEPRITEIETPADAGERTGWLRILMNGDWAASSHDYTPWRSGVMAALADLPDQTAVFTHFVSINTIVGLIEDLPEVVVFRPGNCSVTVLVRADTGFRVLKRGEEIDSRVL